MNESKCSRRGFFKVAAGVAGVTLAAPALLATTDTKRVGAYLDYPRKKIGSLSLLEKEGEIDFNYPDESSPCKAVYVDGKVKAYSILCTHKGCPTMYDAEKKIFVCPCHFSKFDAQKDGQAIISQSTGKLPRVLVTVEDNNVVAYGIDGLIFGRIANTL